ncbi:unnamed protein product [Prunus brigantina]
MSEKGLQIVTKREALTGMKKGMPLKSCMHCLVGKQHIASFQHGPAQRKHYALDVMYSNVCGPMTTSTLGSARYFVTSLTIIPKRYGLTHLEQKIKCIKFSSCFMPKLNERLLPKRFWGEALMTAVNLINLSPSAHLNGDVLNKF